MWFLWTIYYHNGIEVSELRSEIHVYAKFVKFHYRMNLSNPELFGKWRHNKLVMGNAHGLNNGIDHIAVAGQNEN